MIKAFLNDSGEWCLDVLGNPYGGPNGGKDTHGEFFSPNTKFREDYHGLPPAVYYHGYDPRTGRPMGTPEYIGRTIKRWVDAAGVWYKVILDKGSEYARRVWDASQALKAVASTGSADHLIRVNRGTGEIEHWVVVELSIWDGTLAPPANSYAVAIPAIKSLYSAVGLDLPAELIDQPINQPNKENTSMTPEEVQQMIADGVASALKSQREADAAAAQVQAAEEARIQERVDAALKADREARAADRRLPGGELYMDGQAPYAAKFADVNKYDGLDAADAMFLIGVVNSKPGQRASTAAYKAAFIKAAEDKTPTGNAVKSAMKAAGINPADFLHATKANELMYTTQAGYGDEWIGVGYSNQLWMIVRDPTRIMSLIPEIIIPQGAEGVYDPLEGADPIFYKVAEATDNNGTTGRPDATITASKAATDRVLHTATKIGGRVIWTGEMDEDSLIPMMSGDEGLRAKMEVAAAEALENVGINGDTDASATTNINLISGTPGATALYLSFNGFRKLALITNTANKRSASGSLVDTDFLETAKLMGTAGLLGSDTKKALFLIDPNVRWKVLTLAALKTRDVFENATIENGEFTGIYGYRVRTSYQFHANSAKRMADTSGKINGTDSSNTTGSILCVRPDQWKLARKRRTKIETSRWPESDANQIVVTLRAGMKPRDNEAAAISYNVGV